MAPQVKVALAQINPTVGDIAGNVAKILEFAGRARSAGCRLVIFPELAVSGYPPMDLLLKDSFVDANGEAVNELARRLPDIAALVGFVDRNRESGRPLHNACAFLHGGKLESVQHKTLLPTYDVFDEDRYFEPARTYVLPRIRDNKLGDINIGVSICEDIWNDAELNKSPRYGTDPIAKIMAGKPKFLVNISASPYAIGKENIRLELVRNQALKQKIPVLYVNQVGGNDELVFDGRSLAVNARGELVAQARAFAEELLLIDIDDETTGSVAANSSDRTINTYEALVLGTHDYIAKCGFKKVVLGLSGGIDSAVVACLAAAAIGADNVVAVLMPSPYSSAGSITDARELAENLGIKHMTIPIEKTMQAYAEVLAAPFAGTTSDVTEENIQARIRGSILMSLSNKYGYLLLSTGNKSELAVGYCTLYGDMCGGLAVISDLPKMAVYELASYINERSRAASGRDLIPQAIIDKAPSAELRPNQKDQDSLPPYVVLDGIIQAYVEQRRPLPEIVKLGYDPTVVADVIKRIDANEYKRYQAAIGLKVSSRAFGSGWRMPIAHGFKEHLNKRELLC